MKKLLVFISLILCITMLFVSCADKDIVDDEEEYAQPVDNVEDNVNMLVEELNKAETLQELIDNSQTTIDGKELVAELNKLSASGKTTLTMYTDGYKNGTVEGEFAIKKNNLYASATNVDGEQVGINAKINDAMNLAFAVWNKDGDDIEIAESEAIDLEEFFEACNVEIGNSLSINTNDIPVDLSEIKLPEFTKDNIVYKDGKYFIDNNFLYDAIIVTVDAIIDSAKNNGEEFPEDFDELYEAFLDQARDVVDIIDFELYYFIELKTIQGFGMSFDFDVEKVAEVLDVDKDEFDGAEYMKLAIEVSTKHQIIDLELKSEQDGLEKLEYKIDYIYDGKEICGYDLQYNLISKSISSDGSRNEYGDGYSYEYYTNDTVTTMEQSIYTKIDLSAFEKSNADVVKSSLSLYEKTESYYEYGNEGGAVDVQESQTEQTTAMEMSIKTTEPNKADVDMTVEVKTDSVYNGQKEKNSSTAHIEGTMEFTTNNVKVPEAHSDVKDAMNEALKDPISSFN